jgi:hypothetical protein
LNRAQEIAPEQVNEWIEDNLSGVAVEGGVRRIPEIRRALLATLTTNEGPPSAQRWRQYLSLALPLALFFFGGLVDRSLARSDLPSGPKSKQRRGDGRSWRRAFLPGLEQVAMGRGFRVFLTLLLPTAILLLPFVRQVGYRAPLGYDAGRWFIWLLTFSLLGLWLGIRAIRELRR